MMDKKNFLGFVATEETLTSVGPKNIKMNHKKWKPSELETAILKIHFQTNHHPSLDEQESILKNLKVTFNSQVRLAQLTQWFKNERERTFNKPGRICKNSYRKFQKEEIDYLSQNFTEDNYPKLSTMTDMAERMNCTLSKIENWYKHNRRMLAQQGYIKFKARKYFKKNELEYLLNSFDVDPCPNKSKMMEIAGKLNCDRYQIKNWYSNRRKKFRILDRKNNCQGVGIIPEPIQEVYMSSPESESDDLYLEQETPLQPYTIEELVPGSPLDHMEAYIQTENQYSFDLHITQETNVLQNSSDNCVTTGSNISQEIFVNCENPQESSYESSSRLPFTRQDQASNTDNQQEPQIMPQNNQSPMPFQPFGHTMYQGMSPMNMNTMQGGVFLQPMPTQNMLVPLVHYPNAWQHPGADDPFGSFAQPSKKIIVMRAMPMPVPVIQNPVKFVVFY